MKPQILNVRQVARKLHVTEYTVRAWARSGKIPSGRVGARGRLYFHSEDIEPLCAPVNARIQS